VEVDGSLNPDQVPDDVAYLQFFLVLAKRQSADAAMEERRRRAYVEYFFNRNCAPRTRTAPLTSGQIDHILALADEVSQRFAAGAAPPTGRDGEPGGASVSPGPSAAHRQALAVAALTAASLDAAIGPDLAARIRAHVTGHVKRRLKFVRMTMAGPSKDLGAKEVIR
jgi:phosphatidylethanolamine-binding protein (PEBP) family uncharacterized protein